MERQLPDTSTVTTAIRSGGRQPDLRGLTPDELAGLVGELGEARYRADQLVGWLYGKGVPGLAEMTNLPKRLRDCLSRVASVTRLRQVTQQESGNGQAVKFLFELPQGERIEAVLIIEGRRRTACLSSQVGCALDCKFCATGRMGFIRNLTAAQIVDQLLQIGQFLAERDERLTNVVMMGMGEPLLNLANVTRAITLFGLPEGPAIGGRRITISTAGHVPGIRRLAVGDLNVGLAISLNATTDALRRQIMPINSLYPIEDLLGAAEAFYEKRGRRVTFEYVLMAGFNDGDDAARRLAEVSRRLPCKVNLIPYNELGEGTPYRRPPARAVARFRRLVEAGTAAAVTVRDSRGRDIDAACGQLFQEVTDGLPGGGAGKRIGA